MASHIPKHPYHSKLQAHIHQIDSKYDLHKLLNYLFFVVRVDIIAPAHSLVTPQSLLTVHLAEQSYSYRAHINPALFLSQEFLAESKQKECNLLAVSCQSLHNPSNAICLTPEGKFFMAVNEAQFRKIGLQGTSRRGSDTRLIVVDTAHTSYMKGKKLYERVQWCFSQERFENINIFLASDHHLEFNQVSTSDLICKAVPIQTNSITLSNINTVPDFPSIFDNADEDNEDLDDAFEWIGGVLVDCLPYLDQPQYPLIDNPSKKIHRLTAQGLLSKASKEAIVGMVFDSVQAGDIPWAIVVLHGHISTPVLWSSNQHPKHFRDPSSLNGGSGMTLIMLPGNKVYAYRHCGEFDS